jgi:ABC-type branched-subunit amino acid transport system ATPase component
MNDDDVILRVKDLCLRYPGAGDLAVDHASLEVRRGQIALVAGPNGAGKTSLVRSITGFLRGERGDLKGSIAFEGKETIGSTPDRTANRGVYYIPEHGKVFVNLSVRENLRIFAGRTRETPDADRAFEVFPRVRELMDRTAGLLSGGEQQMVALCGAMMTGARLLVIDEPCQGLAPIIVDEVMRVLQLLRETSGVTVLMVDQNLRNTLPISDVVFQMYAGQVASVDAEELKERVDSSGYAQLPAAGGSSDRQAAPAPSPRRAAVSSTASQAPGSPQPLLVGKDVGVSFGNVHAVRNVSVEISAGETVGLAGANGAGKSSLLNCISGLYRVSHGELLFKGVNIVGMIPEAISALGIGRTVQHSESLRGIGARDAMMLGLHATLPKGILKYSVNIGRTRAAERAARVRVMELAENLGITAEVRQNLPMRNLPYGIRKRVDIGRALVARPSLVLYDEPASGLSAEEKYDLSVLIENLAQNKDRAQLIVDHDINFLTRICDRIVVMGAGEVIAVGPPSEIWKDEAVIRSYIGE